MTLNQIKLTNITDILGNKEMLDLIFPNWPGRPLYLPTVSKVYSMSFGSDEDLETCEELFGE